MPDRRIPTDPNSLLSIAAVLGTILGAVVIGLFVVGLNPTDPIVGGVADADRHAVADAEATPRRRAIDARADAVRPTPALPGHDRLRDDARRESARSSTRSRRSRRR